MMIMFNKRRFVSVLLACLTLASCGSGSVVNDTSVTDSDSTEPEATMDPIYADLPTGDFGGQSVKFLGECGSNWAIIQLSSDEINGEIINDRMYEADRLIEQKLNVKIESDYLEDSGDVNTIVQNAVAAGEDEYDVYDMPSDIAGRLITGGYFRDISDLTDISDKVWWDKNTRDSLTFGGKCYSLLGDVSLMLAESHYVLFQNKDIAADIGLDNIYDTVKSGKWTLDILGEHLKKAAQDTNGNGKMDFEDRWGLGIYQVAMTYFMLAGENPIVSTDSDGIPYFNGVDERTADMYNKIFTTLYDQQYTAIGGTKNVPSGKDWKTPFMEGRSLYLFEPLGHSKKMRDSKFDFAIIPMPKYDESQEEYMTPILQYVHTMYVTVANQKTDVIGATLENMAAEYYKTLRPAYYEAVLENKRVRDDESLEMLEIIFKNRELNPAVVFDWKITSILNDAALNGKDTIVSDVERQSKQIQKAINNTVDFYRQ